VVRVGDAGANELVTVPVWAHRARQPGALEPRQRIGDALQRLDRGADEELEPDEGGDWIPGQPEHQAAVADTEGDRLSGLDRHAPEDLVDPKLRLNRANEVV